VHGLGVAPAPRFPSDADAPSYYGLKYRTYDRDLITRSGENWTDEVSRELAMAELKLGFIGNLLITWINRHSRGSSFENA
jgi:tRNA U34 5-methylaminomethyl-2-thiouridine-forming methyltransferase MnmC